MSPSQLQASELQIIRGNKTAVEIQALEIRKGEVLTLIGPNGAGKTTLLMALAALLPEYFGELRYEGKLIGKGLNALEYRRKTGFVFQTPLLLDMKVKDHVLQALKYRGIKRARARMKAEETMEQLGIEHLSSRRTLTLSTGEAQRVALASAFVTEPEILFLDEPTSSLDVEAQDKLQSDLRKILDIDSQNRRITICYATHDRKEALALSDRIAILNDGKILEIGTPEEVSCRSEQPFVSSFMGVENLFQGTVSRTADGFFVLALRGCDIEAIGDKKAGTAALIGIRPEHVTLDLPDGSALSSARNRLTGTVLCVRKTGPLVRVDLDCGIRIAAMVTQASAHKLQIIIGQKLVASFKATAVQVYR